MSIEMAGLYISILRGLIIICMALVAVVGAYGLIFGAFKSAYFRDIFLYTITGLSIITMVLAVLYTSMSDYRDALAAKENQNQNTQIEMPEAERGR